MSSFLKKFKSLLLNFDSTDDINNNVVVNANSASWNSIPDLNSQNFTNNDISFANNSIYMLNLSERTYNALNRNWIHFLKDFSKFSPDIRSFSTLKWLWRKAIEELDNSFKKIRWYENYSLKNCRFYIYWKFELWNSNLSEQILDKPKVKKPPFFEVNNNNYYLFWPSFVAFQDMRIKNFLLNNNLSFYDILTKQDLGLMRGAWKSSLKAISDFNLDVLRFYWVNDISDLEVWPVDKLDFLFMFSWFYSWLSDFDKKIIWLRSDRFNKWWSKVTLEDIWNDCNVTRERVRQLEVRDSKLYFSFLRSISNPLENYLIDKMFLRGDYTYLYYWEIEYSSTFSMQFLQKSFSEIFCNEYWFYWSNDFFFFFKLWEGVLKNEVSLILNKLDKFYYAKKIKDQSLSYDVILKNTKSNNFLLKWIIKCYLLNRYWINENNWIFVFPFNKRNYDSLVMDELELLDDPVHFSELYKILCQKYPNFKFKEQTVHGVLWWNDDAINVWRWLYIHVKKRPYLKWLKTSEDVIVKFLSEKENKRATVSEIVYFVKQYKDVDSWSIEAVLSLNKYWNFVKINNKEFWLKWFW